MFDGAGAAEPMSWSTIWILFACLVGGGGIVAWVGWRSATGRLGRNWLVGIRIPATLESDEAWEAAHRAAGYLLTVGGVVPILVGLFLLTGPDNGVGLAVVLGALAWMLGWVLAAGVAGQRAARSVE